MRQKNYFLKHSVKGSLFYIYSDGIRYPHRDNEYLCCSVNTGVSTCRIPLENFPNKFVLATVHSMSCPSYLEDLRDGK